LYSQNTSFVSLMWYVLPNVTDIIQGVFYSMDIIAFYLMLYFQHAYWLNFVRNKSSDNQVSWLAPVFLAIHNVEIGRMVVWVQPGQKASQMTSQQNKCGMVPCTVIQAKRGGHRYEDHFQGRLRAQSNTLSEKQLKSKRAGDNSSSMRSWV
jgi:hypothetical protein